MHRWLIVAALVFVWQPSNADTLLKKLKAPSAKSTKEWVYSFDSVHVCRMCWCDFMENGRIQCECGGGLSKKVKGDWSIVGTTVTGDIESTCEFEWKARAENDLVITFAATRGEHKGNLTHYCAIGDDSACAWTDSINVGIKAGHKDIKLYNKVKQKYRAPVIEDSSGYSGDLWYDAGRAKKARQVSEIWYKGDTLSDAKSLAENLKGIIGPITPQKWTWGGPYDLILVVGKQKATGASAP